MKFFFLVVDESIEKTEEEKEEEDKEKEKEEESGESIDLNWGMIRMTGRFFIAHSEL